MPQVAERTLFVALLPFSDIKMAWLPTYTDHTPRRRPIYPNWIGVDTGATFVSAIAPISWMPTLLNFLNAPRLHQTYAVYKGDALSGQDMDVAQKMAWDFRPKAPFFMRPRLRTGHIALVVPTAVIAAGEPCVELIDVDFTAPTLVAEAVTYSTLLAETFTVPDLITENLC